MHLHLSRCEEAKAVELGSVQHFATGFVLVARAYVRLRVCVQAYGIHFTRVAIKLVYRL